PGARSRRTRPCRGSPPPRGSAARAGAARPTPRRRRRSGTCRRRRGARPRARSGPPAPAAAWRPRAPSPPSRWSTPSAGWTRDRDGARSRASRRRAERVPDPAELARDRLGDGLASILLRKHVPGVGLDLEVRRDGIPRLRRKERPEEVLRALEAVEALAEERHVEVDAPLLAELPAVRVGERLGEVVVAPEAAR